MLVARSLLFNVLFYVALIVVMILGLPTMLLSPRAIKELARTWGRVSLWLLRVVCGMRFELRGAENIPAGGCIVAAKHQSLWDVFALTLVLSDFTYVLKRELTWIPLFGWYLTRARQIAIDRSRGRAALAKIAEKARGVIGDGGQLIIFPEGTRRPAGAEPNYKFGVAYLYANLQVPLVPVALNSGLFWPRRQFLRRPGTVVIEVLPPIPAGVPPTELLPLLQERLEAACNALNAEALARNPALGDVLPAAAHAAANG